MWRLRVNMPATISLGWPFRRTPLDIYIVVNAFFFFLTIPCWLLEGVEHFFVLSYDAEPKNRLKKWKYSSVPRAFSPGHPILSFRFCEHFTELICYVLLKGEKNTQIHTPKDKELLLGYSAPDRHAQPLL